MGAPNIHDEDEVVEQRDVAIEVDSKLRDFTGRFTVEDLEEWDLDEEIENFQPLRRKKKKY